MKRRSEIFFTNRVEVVANLVGPRPCGGQWSLDEVVFGDHSACMFHSDPKACSAPAVSATLKMFPSSSNCFPTCAAFHLLFFVSPPQRSPILSNHLQVSGKPTTIASVFSNWDKLEFASVSPDVTTSGRKRHSGFYISEKGCRFQSRLIEGVVLSQTQLWLEQTPQK